MHAKTCHGAGGCTAPCLPREAAALVCVGFVIWMCGFADPRMSCVRVRGGVAKRARSIIDR